MKKYFLGIITFLSITLLTSAAYSAAGISLMYVDSDTSGTESEKSGDVGPEVSAEKTVSEKFYGASVFVEGQLGGITVGLDYVPLDIELGSGSRTDTASDTNETTNDAGTYSASADLEDLLTLYVNVPVGPGYLLGGIHHVNITTAETLPNSTYGDKSVFGYQVGYGIKGDRLSIEAFYSDFESITLNSTSGSSKVSADADAMGIKVKATFGG